MASWWLMAPELEHLQASQFYGRGIEHMFPQGGQRTVTPWPRGGSRKDVKDYDEGKVHAALAAPAQLQELDPRNLRSTQPGITRSGVEYYSTPEYHRTGRTYQDTISGDRGSEGNRFPVVYRREAHPDAYSNEPENLLLSGHHRAAAALAEGRPLRARIVEGGWGGERSRRP